MAIRNWQEHGLYMDFSELNVGRGQPSDVDMLYIGKNGFLVIGEIKHRRGELKDGQRRLLTKLVDNYKYGGIVIFIQHDCDVHEGYESVDVSRQEVVEYYYRRKWYRPTGYITVYDVIEKYS